MKINRIDIVPIPLTNQPAAKAFYQEVLGFEVIRDNPMGPDLCWVQLAPRGAETSITLVTWFEKMPPGSVQEIVIDTDDIESTHADLKSRGLEVSPIEEAHGAFATFSGPDGNGWGPARDEAKSLTVFDGLHNGRLAKTRRATPHNESLRKDSVLI